VKTISENQKYNPYPPMSAVMKTPKTPEPRVYRKVIIEAKRMTKMSPKMRESVRIVLCVCGSGGLAPPLPSLIVGG